jgi:energy-coupling factor transport system ATP-binding protein
MWNVEIREFRYSPAEEPILHDLRFTIVPGKIHHVCGPSGCGKSTLLGLLSGQLPVPDSGMVFSGDLRTLNAAEIRRSAQDPLMQIAAATVIDELLLGPEYREATVEQALEKARKSALAFRQQHLLERDTSRLSFGQARLLGLATLWQYPADLVLLDEPFVGLDTLAFEHVQDAVKRLADSGCAVLLTHTRGGENDLFIELNPLRQALEPLCFDVAMPVADVPLQVERLRYSGWEGREEISFRVEPGQALIVTGPNGAGKTRLLQHLAGMIPAESGEVLGPLARAYVAQNPDREMFAATVADEIMVGAQCSAAVGGPWLEFFGLAAQTRCSPLLLSYGQKKRVSLIGALMRQPTCLLLDEPLAGLDSLNQQRVVHILEKFLKRGGIVLAATHEPELFARLQPRRLQLQPGDARQSWFLEAMSASRIGSHEVIAAGLEEPVCSKSRETVQEESRNVQGRNDPCGR